MSGVTEARRTEFSVGRWCARRALSQVGAAPAAIPVGPLRAPVWPGGFLGSITHAAGLCAAVAVPRGSLAGLGIDLVEDGPARAILAESGALVAGEDERARASIALPADAGDPLVLLFAAKESSVKALSASLGRFLDFTELTVTLDRLGFQATLEGSATVVRGWWGAVDGVVATAAVLERRAAG